MLMLMLRMVLLSISIATFSRLPVPFCSPLSFHLNFGLRLSLLLFFSLTDNLPLFLMGALLMSAYLAILLATVTSGALGVFALFSFLLVGAPS